MLRWILPRKGKFVTCISAKSLCRIIVLWNIQYYACTLQTRSYRNSPLYPAVGNRGIITRILPSPRHLHIIYNPYTTPALQPLHWTARARERRSHTIIITSMKHKLEHYNKIPRVIHGQNLRTWVTHSHLRCDALPVDLPSPWEQVLQLIFLWWIGPDD